MRRLFVALLLVAGPAHAFEISVETGPASVAGDTGPGMLGRVAIAAEELQLGLQSLVWRDADGSLPQRHSLSLRWQRTFSSTTAAAPMLLVGLDLGLLGRHASKEYEADGLVVSGHFGAGVRVALSERLFSPMLVVATAGGGPPALAVVVGLGASFD